MHSINSFFGWPDGSVWGNLVAALVTYVPVWLFGMWRFEKRHQQHQRAIHKQIATQFSNLKDETTK